MIFKQGGIKMKNIFFLIVIATSTILAQSWNDVTNTSISQSGFMQMEIFSNKDGIHIVFDNDSEVKYYLINTIGTTIRSTTLYSYDIKYVNITGNKDTVFVMYYYNGYIRGKYSVNAGQSWSDLTNIQLQTYNDCNGLDIVKDKRGIHVV